MDEWVFGRVGLWTSWSEGGLVCRQVVVCGRVGLWTNYSVKSGSVIELRVHKLICRRVGLRTSLSMV